MGINDKLRKLKRISSSSKNAEMHRRRISQTSVTPAQVTEQSLQVWRALPSQIRHDPSMASFQMENERLHGSSITDEDSIIPDDYEEDSPHEDEHFSEYIHMKKLSKPKEHADDKSVSDEGTHSDHDRPKHMSWKLHEKRKTKEQRNRERTIKRTGLLLFWVFTAAALLMFDEKDAIQKTLNVPVFRGNNYHLPKNPEGDFKLKIFGAFNDSLPRVYNETDNILIIQPQISYNNVQYNSLTYKDVLTPWYVPIVSEELFDNAAIMSRNITYQMTDELLEDLRQPNASMRLHIYTNVETDFTIQLHYNPLIVNVKTGTMLAVMVLLIFYGLLVWEVFERTFIALICSTLSIAILACFNDRPSMEEIVLWMDMELLTLIFCMMIMVGILTETGVFDYVAVVAFEISGGKIWPMIYSLCCITCFVSSFLDNLTTVLLMTPVAIRLCEVMSLDPVPVIMGIIVHSNIGGSVTPIGDPISIIICSNHFIAQNGVTFMKFVEHTIPGVILSVIVSCIYLRIVFRDTKSLRLSEPKELKDLRREIKVWLRAANAISSFSKDADLVRNTLLKKVKILKHTLRRKQRGLERQTEAYVHTLEDLKLKYPIKNTVLLKQACGALAFVIVCFFVQSVPELRTLPLGWVALLGMIALLIVSNRDDMDHMMHRIEWTTLLFFAAMFVMMECVERMGVFTWVGTITENIILFVDKRQRLAIAIFIILWISALASAVLDSIPVTAMMVKVVVSLGGKESLGLPLEPLVWALTFGSCLGGNGTLYGASSNVVSAGIAEQHGYKITFTRYLRTVFPMMLVQATFVTAYLILAHIVWEWH